MSLVFLPMMDLTGEAKRKRIRFWATFGVVSLLLAAALVYLFFGPFRSARMLSRAEALLEAEAEEAAQIAAINAVRAGADTPEAWNLILRSLGPEEIELQLYARARLADREPENVENLRMVASLALLTNRPLMAHTATNALQQLGDSPLLIQNLRMRIAAAQGNLQAGAEAAKSILAENPQDRQARFALAVVSVQKASVEELPAYIKELEPFLDDAEQRLAAA